MGQLTQTTAQIQVILDDADDANVGKTSLTDGSDTTAVAFKKSGFYSLQGSSSNAPSTDRAVLISAVRDTAATGEIRYGQIAITESNGLWWNRDDGGSLGTWYEAVTTASAQTLTNKTLTSPVLTTPQINDSAADHQYIFAGSNLVADRTVTLPLLTGNDTFVFEAHTQTLTNKTLTTPTVSGLTLSDASIIFEGATANDYETTLTVTDPTADRTITLPDATDTLVGLATTDTLTNKTLTSPVLNTGVSGTAVLDADDFTGASATTLATSESIKAYVDTKFASGNELSEVLAAGNTTGGTNIVVSVNDVISLDDGTNALPSLTTTGDLNTGIYFPSADNVGITTGGTQRVNVSSTGLDVTGVVEATGYLAVEGTSGNTGVAGDRWIGGDGTAGTWFYNVPTGSNHYFAVNNANKLAINSSGIDVTGTVTASNGAIIKSVGTDNTPADLSLWHTDASIVSGDGIAVISAEGSDSGGSPPYQGAKILFDAAANWDTGTSNYYATNIKFFTQDNSGTDTIAAGPRMTITSAGDVGIGTSPSTKLHVADGADSNAQIRINGSTSTVYSRLYSDNNGVLAISTDGGNQAANSYMMFEVKGSERMRIDASGNVGIGVVPTTDHNPVAEALQIGSTGNLYGRSDAETTILSSNSYLSLAGFPKYITTNEASEYTQTSGNHIWYNAPSGTAGAGCTLTERMRIDASGNVGIGTSSPSSIANYVVVEAQGDTTTTGGIYYTSSSDSSQKAHFYIGGGVGYLGTQTAHPLAFTTSNTERMRIDASGNVGIGTASPVSSTGYTVLTLNNATNGGNIVFQSNGTAKGYVYNSSSQFRIEAGASTPIVFANPNGEAARIDASRNLLVGKTVSGTANTGAELRNGSSNHAVIATSTSETPLVVNRKTNDGPLVNLLKDGTTEGSIGVASNVLKIFATSSANCGIGFYSNSTVRPLDNSGALADDAIDLGDSGTRWDDIYATNGTIQTSDRNEKQDIEELSDAEQRVAVAAKGLLRKFRWKSSVAEKGDEARTHFGIIAQDLQAAFEAEGLDAGNYAMFINSTWTDEETGEERSRMGVRYSELLAFIIAAI